MILGLACIIPSCEQQKLVPESQHQEVETGEKYSALPKTGLQPIGALP